MLAVSGRGVWFPWSNGLNRSGPVHRNGNIDKPSHSLMKTKVTEFKDSLFGLLSDFERYMPAWQSAADMEEKVLKKVADFRDTLSKSVAQLEQVMRLKGKDKLPLEETKQLHRELVESKKDFEKALMKYAKDGASFLNGIDEDTRIANQKSNQFRSELQSMMGKFHDLVGFMNIQDDLGGDLKFDAIENENEYTVLADMPGVAMKDIEVSVLPNNILKVIATKHDYVDENMTDNEDQFIHHRERVFGAHTRMIRLPMDADGHLARAHLRKGVLSIHVPRDKSALLTPLPPKLISIGK